MKIKRFAVLVAFALFSAASLSAKAKEIITVQKEFKVNNANKKLCYQLMEGGKIVFLFDSALNEVKYPKKVYLEGSFNGWAKKRSDFELQRTRTTTWTYECNLEDVMVPGNSGFPEFKFNVVADVEHIESICGKEFIKKVEETFEPNLKNFTGFQMATNNLILLDQKDTEIVLKNVKVANTLKKLKDFDLENTDDVATISNVRLVPGTSKLYRGYHPYKMSRSQFDTEKERIRLVNKQIRDNGVKAIITLSGDEELDIKKEQMSVYVTDIRQAENQYFVDTHYNTVYYKSNTVEFGSLMAGIIKFICKAPGPYYVHCRLGTDRTGVVSANLAALCGASWEDIAADYQKTNDMGIREFRDYRLLQYSFENMLGKKLSEVENLQEAVASYYVDNGFVTKSDLEMLRANLR